MEYLVNASIATCILFGVIMLAMSIVDRLTDESAKYKPKSLEQLKEASRLSTFFARKVAASDYPNDVEQLPLGSVVIRVLPTPLCPGGYERVMYKGEFCHVPSDSESWILEE